eukprot:CAMPEP_0176128898 /NCGR_PEP_ID=MMETSP0120_2-20121206/65152_1 /TAXON_ID=160619 /ORGANISM="Kryptoperidinium foliaceum, Strain CCMP 1326" /LENGTH=186 /DNA_ID=CAMNT_0017464037 /DNA_START=156 /DNA_END=712 /DNA_ORIENTATION=-
MPAQPCSLDTAIVAPIPGKRQTKIRLPCATTIELVVAVAIPPSAHRVVKARRELNAQKASKLRMQRLREVRIRSPGLHLGQRPLRARLRYPSLWAARLDGSARRVVQHQGDGRPLCEREVPRHAHGRLEDHGVGDAKLLEVRRDQLLWKQLLDLLRGQDLQQRRHRNRGDHCIELALTIQQPAAAL